MRGMWKQAQMENVIDEERDYRGAPLLNRKWDAQGLRLASRRRWSSRWRRLRPHQPHSSGDVDDAIHEGGAAPNAGAVSIAQLTLEKPRDNGVPAS